MEKKKVGKHLVEWMGMNDLSSDRSRHHSNGTLLLTYSLT